MKFLCPSLLDLNRPDKASELSPIVRPKDGQTSLLCLQKITYLKDAANDGCRHYWLIPKVFSQSTAFAAASLLSRFTEFVAELDTLHSIGIRRVSFNRKMTSAFRLPSFDSPQNSPFFGPSTMVEMAMLGTCFNQ